MLYFKGIISSEKELKNIKNPKVGDCYCLSSYNKTYVYNGIFFDCIEPNSNTDSFHKITTKIITNCKNCGAIIKNGKCEYCGTEYGRILYKEIEVLND